MELLEEYKLTQEAEELWQKFCQCHFVHHKSHATCQLANAIANEEISTYLMPQL
jgi:hypothetical protein